MLDPGIYALADESITGAVTLTASEPITGLDGVSSLSVDLLFTYGSGGTSGSFWVQTSLDQGNTWIDLACMAVTTTTKRRVFNLKLTDTLGLPTAAPSDGALADNTISSVIVLGDRFRLKRTTVGTYAESSIRARISAR